MPDHEPPDWALPSWDALDIGTRPVSRSGPGRPAGTFGPRVLGVTEVTHAVRDALRDDPRLGDLWVEGEVGRVTVSSAGHAYFTLRDEKSQLACVFFREERQASAFEPQSGMRVVVHGRIDVFDAQGVYQCYVAAIQPAGFGDLALRFEQTKARLAAEGLFDAGRKRPLPARPTTIGIVTSLSGAVIHDIRRVLARRWPLVQVVVSACRVQGDGAAETIVAALGRLARYDTLCREAGRAEEAPGLIIVARGGGSLEDLLAFNDERVVRAIAAHPVPVVSGVGHETDVTLADFVADLRAPTPSAAAELVAPDRLEATVRLSVLAATLLTSCQGEVEQRRAGVAQTVNRLERLLPDMGRERQRIDDLWRQASTSLEAFLRQRRERLSGFAGQLRSLDPKGTLARGYALVQRDGHVVSSVGEVAGGERLSVRVKDGGFPVRVEKAAGARPSARQVRKGEKHSEGVQPLLMVDP